MSVAANSKPLDAAKTHPVTESIRTEVLIIGAGLAGLSTALALPKSLNIIMPKAVSLQA